MQCVPSGGNECRSRAPCVRPRNFQELLPPDIEQLAWINNRYDDASSVASPAQAAKRSCWMIGDLQQLCWCGGSGVLSVLALGVGVGCLMGCLDSVGVGCLGLRGCGLFGGPREWVVRSSDGVSCSKFS